MKTTYGCPRVEIVSLSTEDIISTSPTIELPWLPLDDDSKEIM